MDENQVGTLGSKMRDVYADVASEPAVPSKVAPKHPSRRLRKSPAFARTNRRSATSVPHSSADSFFVHHPIASLLIAAGAGYVIARL